jgi:hypothetical protein
MASFLEHSHCEFLGPTALHHHKSAISQICPSIVNLIEAGASYLLGALCATSSQILKRQGRLLEAVQNISASFLEFWLDMSKILFHSRSCIMTLCFAGRQMVKFIARCGPLDIFVIDIEHPRHWCMSAIMPAICNCDILALARVALTNFLG